METEYANKLLPEQSDFSCLPEDSLVEVKDGDSQTDLIQLSPGDLIKTNRELDRASKAPKQVAEKFELPVVGSTNSKPDPKIRAILNERDNGKEKEFLVGFKSNLLSTNGVYHRPKWLTAELIPPAILDKYLALQTQEKTKSIVIDKPYNLRSQHLVG